ncbi:hypothetical protein SASPL_102662 [Salvia splendens]|uniref:Uncharacterized protein n=1 Tax=Salvia splendens TaxID=180675 RepID=A0A8X8YSC9_SALSN|nr:hypothetical protein SASPL_102662 [Salvia splendens]
MVADEDRKMRRGGFGWFFCWWCRRAEPAVREKLVRLYVLIVPYQDSQSLLQTKMAPKLFKSINKLILYLSILAAAVCIATFSKAYSLKSFLRPDASSTHAAFFPSHVNEQEITQTLNLVIHKLQHELDQIRVDTPLRSKHAPLLADVLGLIDSATCDWKLAQKLMIHGCDPLPRRRCYALAPQIYTRPLPINESLWKLPDDRNVQWGGYRCKNFTCLASNVTKKGFFKCAECFNLVDHESPRWIKPVYQNPNISLTSDFMISDVLDLKRGEIRIGLDFSVGTGTFAARMREHNVTIVTAAVNLGAPFNEMIALRGLVPLYVTVNQRLPFFDNTLDVIHTTRFLDGWIDLVLLEFVEDLDDYLGVFGMMRYKRHEWIVVPKFDKNDDREVFFSAVLEKPSRPFR